MMPNSTFTFLQACNAASSRGNLAFAPQPSKVIPAEQNKPVDSANASNYGIPAQPPHVISPRLPASKDVVLHTPNQLGIGHVVGVMGDDGKERERARQSAGGASTKEFNSTGFVDLEDQFEAGENVIAGAISGLIAETLMHPFDTVSHRAKVHPSSAYGNFAGAFRLICRQEGLRGYFAGVSATVAQSPPANAAYFFTYEALKKYGLNLTGGEYPGAVFFIAGGLSELTSSLCFVPFDVVKSRLQLGENPHRATNGIVSSKTNFSSLPAAMRGIYKESGVRGLTAGWGAGLLLDMGFSGTQFLLYEQFKRMVKKRVKRDPTAMETLLCGCVSGGIAAAITNPLDVIVSRIQCQDGNRGYGTKMSTVFKSTVAEGPIALWRGTLPRVAQIAPLSALSFAVYETMRRYLKGTAMFRESSSGEA